MTKHVVSLVDTLGRMLRFFTYAESSGTPIAVLSLDQEKPFDRVDWGFMRSTLLTMGFGPSFISWVDLFYNRVHSAVNVNGYLASFFRLSRAVR